MHDKIIEARRIGRQLPSMTGKRSKEQMWAALIIYGARSNLLTLSRRTRRSTLLVRWRAEIGS
jgi:hypothetical protein